MNTGVEILLQRIKDNPEDFQYNINTDTSTRWNKLLMEALRSDVITDEEKTALRHEATEMGRARFTERVMKTLAGEDEPSDEGKYHATPSSLTGSNNTAIGYQALSQVTTRHHNSVIGNLAPNSATLTVDNQLRAYNAQLEAQYELLKLAKEAEVKPKVKTLFGKLFNYT